MLKMDNAATGKRLFGVEGLPIADHDDGAETLRALIHDLNCLHARRSQLGPTSGVDGLHKLNGRRLVRWRGELHADRRQWSTGYARRVGALA